MKKFKTIKGINDIVYPESAAWDKMITMAEGIYKSYGYRKLFLPVLEYTELFSRGIGTDTDIVSKEMYTFLYDDMDTAHLDNPYNVIDTSTSAYPFNDRKGRSLSLRPEGTAGTVRAMIENNLLQTSGREKIFYFGPMFRYERPQKGRYRQFYQSGCEFYGSKDISADVEVAEIAVKVFQECYRGEEDLLLEINTVGCEDCRREYREKIREFLKGKEKDLCEDCRRRLDTNTLRILDCKNVKCRQLIGLDNGIETGFETGEFILHRNNLCKNCEDSFNEYKELLEKNFEGTGVRVEPSRWIVRGLDYYTGPVFELRLENSLTVIAGGRYDNLVKELGGPDTPACGWALGMERLYMLSKWSWNNSVTQSGINIPRVYMAFIEGGQRKEFREIASELRKKGYSIEEDLEKRDLGKKLKMADKRGARWVVFMGEEETKKNSVTLKDLKKGNQEEVDINNAAKTIDDRIKNEDKANE
ncbi:MAG: histidine--tRNA ligase [Elusimicrobiota bacterium]